MTLPISAYNDQEAQIRERPGQVKALVGAELLDESQGLLGLGRSQTFPFPQYRAFDRYRTVFFDHGQGRTIVFLHGLGGNATHWELVVRGLEGRHRLVGLDLVGCGWSAKPPVAYTMELLLDHLLDFLDSRRIKRVTLVGHSLGGMVSLAAALKRPDLVEGLGLVCAAGLAPLPYWMRLGAPLALHRAILYPALLASYDFILKNVFVSSDSANEHVFWFREGALRDEPGTPHLRDFARVGETLCRDVVTRDYSQELHRLEMPVLVLCTDHDKLTPLNNTMRSLKAIRKVRAVILKECGHLPMIECPQETLFHLERFLADPP